MVVTDDDEVAARMRLLRSHGMTTLTWDRHRGHASGYDVVDARLQLPHRRAARGAGPPPARRASTPRTAAGPSSTRATASCSTASTALAPTLAPGADARPAHHLFTVVLDEGVDREALPRRRSPSAGSRRASTTRPRTASRSTPAGRRAARDRGLRRARGDAADVRDDDRRPAGRGRRRRPRGARRRARLTDRGARAAGAVTHGRTAGTGAPDRPRPEPCVCGPCPRGARPERPRSHGTSPASP